MDSINYYVLSSKRKLYKKGFTLVEVMIAIILFTIMFTSIFKALAPTATASHNLLRGTTVAMNAANWYLNSLERTIQYEGSLPSSDLGKHSIKTEFISDEFSDIKKLRSLEAYSEITLTNNLYNVKITFSWDDKENAVKPKHHFEMFRLLVKPDI